MFYSLGAVKSTLNLLVVVCKGKPERKPGQDELHEKRTSALPGFQSSGRVEVQTLKNPTPDEFSKVLNSWHPNVIFFQEEEWSQNDKIGSSAHWSLNMSSPDDISGLFSSTFPTTVYLEVSSGELLAEKLHSKGIPYVIYWKNLVPHCAKGHFCRAFFLVLQSSTCHTWDAFQLAEASFKLHCLHSNLMTSDCNISDDELRPKLIGEPPKITVELPEAEETGGDEENTSDSLPAIQIHDDDVNMRFLICGVSNSLDASLWSSLEDGLNALIRIEMRGSKLHSRASAIPPPLKAGIFSRGVVTVRCDMTTSSFAHISLLVSGSAQTCFDDQILENHIKSEIIEKTQLIHVLPNPGEYKQRISEPWRSVSVACGAAVFEVCLKVPTWSSQVLRQLAPDISYRSFAALGVAGIQGLAVASFEKEDAERLLFFYPVQEKNGVQSNLKFTRLPSWLKPPPPSRKESLSYQETSSGSMNGLVEPEDDENKEMRSWNSMDSSPSTAPHQKLGIAALRPIPHVRHWKMFAFSATPEIDMYDGSQLKASMPPPPPKHSSMVSGSAGHRRSIPSSYQAKQVIPLNPLPLKKHGCGRSPLHVCSEEEFLKDVMHFLMLRGHNRLIPQGGLAEFPDAILNATRLDLFNLYQEVVTRGGFHVGNGINWKGQVFSKMRNHTATNRMTGVGNTLKRHYETYLLEYELAHDDVDGECCLLCRSSAPGDWVNCGLCGEWAHFGCDRRPGLGAFKDYAKKDGLEYICPQCSVSTYKKKMQKMGGN